LLVGIDPYRASLERARDLPRALVIPRPDARGEAIDRIVGLLDHIVFIVKRQNAEDRAEDLLLRDRRFIVDAINDRGQIERPACEARIGGGGAAQLEPLTSRPPLTDQLVLRVPKPWQPDGKYEVEIRGLRTVSGVTGDVRGAMSVKPAAKPDSSAQGGIRGADSLKRRPPKKKS